MTLPTKNYIYQYTNSSTGLPVYIGKGSKGRFAEYDKRGLEIKRLRDLNQLKVEILVHGIETTQEAGVIEKHLIITLKNKGIKLLNKVHNK